MCLVTLLATAAVVHMVSRQSVATNDRQRLEAQVRDVAAITMQVGSRIEESLASLHAVVAATGGDRGAFERAVRPKLGNGLFTSVALLAVDAPLPSAALSAGAPVQLLESGVPVHHQRLRESATSASLVPIGRFDARERQVFGFSYGPAVGPGHVVYTELALATVPKLIVAGLDAPEQASAIRNLNLAVYTDRTEQPESLVLAFASSLPLRGERVVQPFRVGSRQWYLVVTPKGPMRSGLELALPWILLVVGLLGAALVTATVEVTLRRRAALETSERRFRLLVQHSSDFITVVDASTTVRSVSDSVQQVLGHSPRDLVGRPIGDLVHPDDALQLVGGQIDGPGPLFLSCRFRHLDGSWRHLEITGTNLRDEPAVGGIVLNARDVTERRAAEDGRAELATIVDSTSDLVATIDLQGRFTYMNPAGRALVGFDGPELHVTLVNEVVAEEDQVRLAEALEEAGRNGIWSGEGTLVTLDGRRVPVW